MVLYLLLKKARPLQIFKDILCLFIRELHPILHLSHPSVVDRGLGGLHKGRELADLVD